MPLGMKMNKVPEYGRPHNFQNSFSIPVESAAVRRSTIYPIITQDEGLGAISAYESNPANANFVEVASDHCFPTSRINNVVCKMEVSMSKVMLETDKVPVIKFRTATIHCAFDDGSAADEISTLSLNEILELDGETTDRQTYPLWNDIDLHDYKSNGKLDLAAETPGLDTDLEIESVVFQTDKYYDCLQYYTNGAKLRQICTPLRTHILTKTHPSKVIYFNQQSNTKYMNPYTFLGALINVPDMGDIDQLGENTDTTIETCVLHFSMTTRYMEFNHEFNHALM